jgi:hypothetical protein
MHNKEQQYIIRSRDEQSLTSRSMSCHKVIDAAVSGHWGTDCLIDEVYIFGNDLPYALRRVAAFSSHRGFQMIDTDKEFHRFLVINDIIEPKSQALNELRELFAGTGPICNRNR